jgi:flavodoxin
MSNTTPGPRALIAYESMFGNTKKVAEAVARGLRSRGYETALHDVARDGHGVPVPADLLVVGAPTHAFSLSRPSTRDDAVRQGASVPTGFGLREWLGSLPSSPDHFSAVAAFDTRVDKVRKLPMGAGRTAAKIAKRRGFPIIDRPQGFTVHDTGGPLCAGELERAEDWGRRLAEVPIHR